MNPPSQTIQLPPCWLEKLEDQFALPYMQELRAFLAQEKGLGKKIFPAGGQYFRAFHSTPYHAVRAVILGQDPYPTPGHAQGLCFSVPPEVSAPPSLLNIYQELRDDLGGAPANGCLLPWAEQGVLLLNSILTVECRRPGAHRGMGWEHFTDRVITLLNEEKKGLVFFLWGSYAQEKGSIVDGEKHLVLRAVHPSPRSAQRGFFGCRHFSQANRYLREQGEPEIHWFPAADAAAH